MQASRQAKVGRPKRSRGQAAEIPQASNIIVHARAEAKENADRNGCITLLEVLYYFPRIFGDVK